MPTKKHQDLVDLRHPTDKKASKPLMEKRRRARINHSLAQLKALVVDPGANTAERSRQAKLEKADILELTVRHLHDMKRQQTLLPDRKKKKFEIGYSECAREVELFLSNLINLDPDVRQRLKDHLGRRLRDFRNTRDDDAASPQKEASDEDEPSPSSSDSVSLIPTEAEDSSDSSSALNKMLKCYAGKRATIPSEAEEADDFRPKRSKQTRPGTTEEMPCSCHSVTSTTGCKSSDNNHPSVPVANRGDVATQKSERNFPIVVGPSAVPVEKCLGRRPGAPMQLTNPPSPRGAILAKKNTADAPAFRQRQKSSGCISPTLSEDEDIGRSRRHDSDPTSRKTDESNRLGCVSPTGSEGEDRRHDSDPIPLLPRRLANGDWALVLPASLMTAKEVVSHPFSAFKLVVPNNHSETGSQSPHSSSSTVSDTSYDELCSRSDGERIGHSSPDSSTHQIVWRPW